MKPVENPICCDGRCNQGRTCPLLCDKEDPIRNDILESVTKVVILLIGIVAGGVIAIGLVVNL